MQAGSWVSEWWWLGASRPTLTSPRKLPSPTSKQCNAGGPSSPGRWQARQGRRTGIKSLIQLCCIASYSPSATWAAAWSWFPVGGMVWPSESCYVMKTTHKLWTLSCDWHETQEDHSAWSLLKPSSVLWLCSSLLRAVLDSDQAIEWLGYRVQTSVSSLMALSLRTSKDYKLAMIFGWMVTGLLVSRVV